MTVHLFSPQIQMHLMILDASRETPVPIAELQRWTGLSVRAIKAEVEKLRRDGEQIGASRGKIHGYYPIRTAADADACASTLWRQILSELKTLRSMLPPNRYAELLGQLRLEA